MTVPADELSLAAGFPAATREGWRDLVLGVLRKSGAAGADTPAADVERLLATTTYDGIQVAPLYTAPDAAGLADRAGAPGLAPFVRGAAVAGGAVAGGAAAGGAVADGVAANGVAAGWDVRAAHRDPDPAATNRAVLTDLENGATSLWLTLGVGGLPVTALGEALREVYLDLAVIILDAGDATGAAAAALLALADERGTKPTELAGNLGADPIGLVARTGARPDLAADIAAAAALAGTVAGRYPRLRAITVDALPYHDAGGADAEELGYALATGVAYLRALTDGGLGVADALGQLEFR